MLCNLFEDPSPWNAQSLAQTLYKSLLAQATYLWLPKWHKMESLCHFQSSEAHVANKYILDKLDVWKSDSFMVYTKMSSCTLIATSNTMWSKHRWTNSPDRVTHLRPLPSLHFFLTSVGICLHLPHLHQDDLWWSSDSWLWLSSVKLSWCGTQ